MNSVSATSVSKFDTCPLQWRFNYILHLLQKEGKALVIGSLYHKCLELHHSGIQTQVAIDEARKTMDSESLALVELMVDKYKEFPVDGNIMETEYSFNIDIPGLPVPIKGFIDRIDEDKGIEYKTSSRDFKEDDTKTIQSKIYSYALWKKFGRVVPIVYSVMNKKKAKQVKYRPQELVITYTEKELLGLEQILLTFYNKATAGSYDPTPGIHCYWCPWGSKLGDGTCINSK